ncbi:hypothetical protein GN956_G4099 [Arapaima gigas]
MDSLHREKEVREEKRPGQDGARLAFPRLYRACGGIPQCPEELEMEMELEMEQPGHSQREEQDEKKPSSLDLHTWETSTTRN